MPGECWVQCYHCGRDFRDKFNLKRHIVLHLKPLKNENRICCMCKKTFSSRNDVVHHYMYDHNVEIRPERLDFKDYDAFESWKINLERREKSVFVKKRGTHVNKNGISKMYYWCQRDGFTPQDRQVFGQRKRRLKKTGYHQINICCPASIKAVVLQDGRVSVNYIATHVGHGAEVERLKLLKSDKALIAKMIAEGRSFVDILNEFRLKPKNGSDDRLRILNLRDLDNIARKFNVKQRKRRDQSPNKNGNSVVKEPSVPESVVLEELCQKLVELNKMWAILRSQVKCTKDADFVLKALLPILNSLKKTTKVPQAMENQTSSNFTASQPPPLVFYSNKLTKEQYTMALRSSKPPELVPMVSGRLTKLVSHNENVMSQTGAESLSISKVVTLESSSGVAEEGQFKKVVFQKNGDRVECPAARKLKGKLAGLYKLKNCVEAGTSTLVPGLVPVNSAISKSRVAITYGVLGTTGGDQSENITPSLVPRLEPTQSRSSRAIRASARNTIPKIVTSSAQAPTNAKSVAKMPRLGPPSALTKVNPSEPPPLVFLPSKKHPSSHIKITSESSAVKEESNKLCSTSKAHQATMVPPLPIKETLNDAKMLSDPPKLVLISSVAQKLINMK